MSNYLSFKVPRLAIFALTLFLAVSPISLPNKVEAAGFSLDPTTSHIGWMFGGGSSWGNKNATYNGQTKDWRSYSTSSLHKGSDTYSDDWFWGVADYNSSCDKDIYAPFSGNVIFKGQGRNVSGGDSAYGHEVIIQADANGNYAWRGAHMVPGSMNHLGSRVNAGDYIGKVGRSGTSDCHLHSTLYKNIHNASNQGYGTAFERLRDFGTTVSYLSGGADQFAVAFYNDADGGGNPEVTCNTVSSYNGIKLYDQDRCNGSSQGWNSSSNGTTINTGDVGWNDRARSVYVGSGWSVKVFEHSNGEGKWQCFRESKWDLDVDQWEGGGIIGANISSVIIYNNSTCTGGTPTPTLSVEFYKDANYGNGYCGGSVANGYYTSFDGCGSGWNDAASSVLIKSGWSARVYEHANHGGSSRCLSSNDSNFAGDTFENGAGLDNQISSFIVYNQSNCPPLIQIPNAPTLSSPANGSTFTDIQQINLSWSGNGSEYYVEITGGPSGTLNTGWISGTSKNIGTQWAGHTYTWKVKTRNSAGESGWSGTRTFTVVPHVQVPSAPTLNSPSNGASFTDAQAITLSWGGNGAEYYVEISGGPAGTLNTGWITGTSTNLGTQWAGYSYTWRVKARNTAGEGAWSSSRTFNVTASVQVPSAPTLTSPANGATFTDRQAIILQWTGNGTEYTGEVIGEPSQVTWIWRSQTSENISYMPAGTYTWRIKARNSAGESPWSTTRTFTVTESPDTTTPTGHMTAPAKGSIQDGPIITLKANAADDRSGVKKVEFHAWSGDTWANSQWILIGSDNTAPYEYSWNVSNLGADTYATVAAVIIDNAGNSTGLQGNDQWTNFTIRNTVITAPPAPSLTSPANESSFNVGQSIQLSWSGSGTEYFGEITGGPNGPITFGWQTTTNKTYTNLAGGYTYRWRVKARNSAGESPWTNSRTFSVGDCNNISGTSIKLFSDQSCRGTVHTASTGFANLTNFNDTAESAYVPAGISARIWSDANRGGATRCITSTMWNFNIDNYENGTKISTNGVSTVSSIEVFNNSNCTPPVVATGCDAINANGVTLFANKACGGASMNVTTTGFIKLAKPNNNAFKSIYLRAGWSVKVFDNKDKTGGKKCIKATVKNLAKVTYGNGQPIIRDGKSTISAIEVYNSTNCK